MYALVVLLLGALWTGCGSSESADVDNDNAPDAATLSEQLTGRWILEKTIRGGKDADYTGAYFEYDAATGTFKSDLMDETQSPVYADGVAASLSEQTLTFDGLSNTFEVTAIDDSTVTLLTNMMNFDFEFTFKRID